jgi:hypothetical protein
MIDGKQAVQQAFQNLFELVGPRELANVDGIQLEELELTDDSKHWNVTLSYPVKKAQEDEGAQPLPESLAKFIKDTPRRKWRTFKLDSQDGRLVAMKLPAST